MAHCAAGQASKGDGPAAAAHPSRLAAQCKPPAGSSSESIARRLNRASVGARAVEAQASRQLDQVRSESRRVKQLEEVAKAALADKLRDAEKRSLEEMTGIHPAVRDWTPRSASRNKT